MIQLDVAGEFLSSANEIIRQASVKNSRCGRSYLLIDIETRKATLTHNKSEASSMEMVSVWMNELSQAVFSSDNISRNDVKRLRDNIDRYVQFLAREESRTLAQTRTVHAMHEIFGDFIGNQIDEATHRLDAQLVNYGKGSPRTRTIYDFSILPPKNIEVEVTIQPNLLYEDATLKVNLERFEQLKSLKEITQQDIMKVIEKELTQRVQTSTIQQEAALEMAVRAFETVLDRISDEIEDARAFKYEERFMQLTDLIIEFIKQNNVEVDLNREEFFTMMGAIVGGDHKPPRDLDIELPQVKKLITEYNNNSWTPVQIKTLKYSVVGYQFTTRIVDGILAIFKDDYFHQSLHHYFETCIPKEEEEYVQLRPVNEQRVF